MIHGDRIDITGIRARGHHGVLESERREGQEFVVDISMSVELSYAARSDDLADTVNYAEVAADVVAIISGPPVDLIETLADQVATAVLARPDATEVEVTVHKPQAPVGVPFGDVAVTMSRTRRCQAVIALGSNLGDSDETLRSAAEGLWGLGIVTAASQIYRSTPVGGPPQDDYRNAVVVLTTAQSPRSVLSRLHELEEGAGRTRQVRWGPRTLDLDLIQYGDPTSDTDVWSDRAELLLPHPRAHERAFVLVPWAQADPDAVLRVEGGVRPVADLAAALGRQATDQVHPVGPLMELPEPHP